MFDGRDLARSHSPPLSLAIPLHRLSPSCLSGNLLKVCIVCYSNTFSVTNTKQQRYPWAYICNCVPPVTIPPLDPSARDEEEPDYDEEAQVWAAAMEHAAEVEDEETPDEYDWQISRLVSAATYTAEPDAGRVSTGRMKIT